MRISIHHAAIFLLLGASFGSGAVQAGDLDDFESALRGADIQADVFHVGTNSFFALAKYVDEGNSDFENLCQIAADIARRTAPSRPGTIVFRVSDTADHRCPRVRPVTPPPYSLDKLLGTVK
jgi:hypothetical protein